MQIRAETKRSRPQQIAVPGGLGIAAITLLLAGCPSGEPPAAGSSQLALTGEDGGQSVLPKGPSNVSASDGISPDRVVVSWERVPGASGYRVYRDGALVGEVAATSYEDAAAEPGVPESPALTASQGTHTDRVQLTWNQVEPSPGITHVYEVTAFNPSGESPPSAGDGGHRAGSPITGYELSVDGGTYDDLGLVMAYADPRAPAATIDPGSASASNGTLESSVRLALLGAIPQPGAHRTYRLRAVSTFIAGAAATATGYRGVGELGYLWQRSSGDADADYADLPGASSATYEDGDAPATGDGRFYRCLLEADGANPIASAAARGFRATLPVVGTESPISITSDGFLARGTLSSLGTPAATGHGVCVRAIAPLSLDELATSCLDLGAPTGVGSFEAPITGLRSGAAYRVRAFAMHPTLGARYGQWVEVVTVPSPPSDVVASDGTSPDHVVVSWASVAGATGYRVHRDGAFINEVTTTSTADTGAGPGGRPAAPTGLRASSGYYTDRVAVSWRPVTPPPGATHAYTVTAVNGSGESSPSVHDDGHRGGFPITSYHVLINWRILRFAGLSTRYTDFTAPAGTITPGTATASDGSFDTHVGLGLTASSTSPGAYRTYAVRAMNAAGSGAMSPRATGYRGIGALGYRWERSAGDRADDYSELESATTAAYDDSTALSTPRFYRCALSASGASTVVSNADRGWRFATPSDIPRDDFWITNGTVLTVAPGDGVVYLGGGFTHVGPPTGSFAALDATTGAPDLMRARVNGRINAAVPDGAGGWYIGGHFTAVDGIPRWRLARILASGMLDPVFTAGAGGSVIALAVSEGVVYVAGTFESVGGAMRNHIAAVDAVTGQVTAWNPNARGPVASLVVSGSTVYAGGHFTHIGGKARYRIAALDASTGQATAWNPDANSVIRSLQVSGGIVYAGGDFTTIGGAWRSRIAALDASTGHATAWNPNADGRIWSLQVSGDAVYAGGDFTSVGGEPRNHLARLDTSTGAATQWNPNASATVYTLAVSGDIVYAGGHFTNIGGATRNRIAALDALTGEATAWNPDADDLVVALAVRGSTVYAGGDFASIGGAIRNRIAALDAVSGETTPWNPTANDTVASLAVSGAIVYAGGDFTSIGAEPRNRIAALDASTGEATAWAPDSDGTVRTMAVSGDIVYAGGSFRFIGGAMRSYVAALDASTGDANSWNPGSSAPLFALQVIGGTVYVGGQFTNIGGAIRKFLAAVDATTGIATAWDPGADWPVFALASDANTIHEGGAFSNIGGQLRRGLAVFAPEP